MSQYYILVSAETFYRELKEQLESYGLEEFEDFVIGGAYGKKLAVINANCYGRFIKAFLYSSEEFRGRYYFYPAREVWVEPEKCCDEAAIRRCDLLLTQDVSEDNPFGICYSEKYVRELTKEKCICMTIPNLVGMGKMIYPQSERNGKAVKFVFDDLNVLKLAEAGMDEEAIIEIVMNGGRTPENRF